MRTHECTCACRNEGADRGQELVYEKLPSDIANRYVLLLDPVLGTGITACRVIQVRAHKEREAGGKLCAHTHSHVCLFAAALVPYLVRRHCFMGAAQKLVAV